MHDNDMSVTGNYDTRKSSVPMDNFKFTLFGGLSSNSLKSKHKYVYKRSNLKDRFKSNKRFDNKLKSELKKKNVNKKNLSQLGTQKCLYIHLDPFVIEFLLNAMKKLINENEANKIRNIKCDEEELKSASKDVEKNLSKKSNNTKYKCDKGIQYNLGNEKESMELELTLKDKRILKKTSKKRKDCQPKKSLAKVFMRLISSMSNEEKISSKQSSKQEKNKSYKTKHSNKEKSVNNEKNERVLKVKPEKVEFVIMNEPAKSQKISNAQKLNNELELFIDFNGSGGINGKNIANNKALSFNRNDADKDNERKQNVLADENIIKDLDKSHKTCPHHKILEKICMSIVSALDIEENVSTNDISYKTKHKNKKRSGNRKINNKENERITKKTLEKVGHLQMDQPEYIASYINKSNEESLNKDRKNKTKNEAIHISNTRDLDKSDENKQKLLLDDNLKKELDKTSQHDGGLAKIFTKIISALYNEEKTTKDKFYKKEHHNKKSSAEKRVTDNERVKKGQSDKLKHIITNETANKKKSTKKLKLDKNGLLDKYDKNKNVNEAIHICENDIDKNNERKQKLIPDKNLKINQDKSNTKSLMKQFLKLLLVMNNEENKTSKKDKYNKKRSIENETERIMKVKSKKPECLIMDHPVRTESIASHIPKYSKKEELYLDSDKFVHKNRKNKYINEGMQLNRRGLDKYSELYEFSSDEHLERNIHTKRNKNLHKNDSEDLKYLSNIAINKSFKFVDKAHKIKYSNPSCEYILIKTKKGNSLNRQRKEREECRIRENILDKPISSLSRKSWETFYDEGINLNDYNSNNNYKLNDFNNNSFRTGSNSLVSMKESTLSLQLFYKVNASNMFNNLKRLAISERNNNTENFSQINKIPISKYPNFKINYDPLNSQSKKYRKQNNPIFADTLELGDDVTSYSSEVFTNTDRPEITVDDLSSIDTGRSFQTPSSIRDFKYKLSQQYIL